MKKKLTGLLRVLVSVGILLYLFNGIFRKEASDYFAAHHINPDTLTWTERAHIVWQRSLDRAGFARYCQRDKTSHHESSNNLRRNSPEDWGAAQYRTGRWDRPCH